MTITNSGDPREAVKYFTRAIDLYENVAKTDSSNLSALRQISYSRMRLGDAFTKAGNGPNAIQIYQTALLESDKIIAKDNINSEFRHDRAVCLLRLAEHRSNAIPNLNQAILILEKLVAESPQHKQRRTDLDAARSLLAGLL